jgi:predicted DCC family thiol-disulfide oxidoreductase YuxK
MTIVQSLGLKAARIREFMNVPHRLVGLALMRVLLGAVTLAFYAQHWRQYPFLWGNDGLIPYGAYLQLMRQRHGWSLYMLSPSPAFAMLVFSLGILVTVAFTVGYKTRVTSVLFYVFTWSLYSRNPFALDGGDNLLFLLAFFIMFGNSGAYFSLDTARENSAPRPARPLAALLHNYAVFAILIQLCLLYFTSAFFKIQGHMWQSGTAIYYILRNGEFNLSPLAHNFYDSDAVVTLLTWSTMVFQIAWPFLVWFRPPRVFLAIGAFMLHTMIGYFMGLVWFSAVMISAELIIFSDSEYFAFAGWVNRLFSNGWAWSTARARQFGAAPVAQGWRLMLFYDGDCPLCRLSIERLTRRLDLFGLIDLKSFRNAAVALPPGVSLADLELRMYATTASGTIVNGIGAVEAVLRRLPVLWWMLPPVMLLRLCGVGKPLYDWIAGRRYALLPFPSCSAKACGGELR